MIELLMTAGMRGYCLTIHVALLADQFDLFDRFFLKTYFIHTETVTSNLCQFNTRAAKSIGTGPLRVWVFTNKF